MQPLTHQRCHYHSDRQAAAKCPSCGHFFCRECIAEHDDRVLCAACLRKLTRTTQKTRRSFAWFFQSGQAVLGVFLLWLFFYLTGRTLLSVPSEFHDGSLWRTYEGSSE